MTTDSEAFWQFSIDRYGRDGVSELCIAWQDTLGVDVNLVLFCIWVGQNGCRIPELVLQDCISGPAGTWQRDIVQPLRNARRAMKDWQRDSQHDVEALRQRVKDLELECERLTQHVLIDTTAGSLKPDASLAENGEQLRQAAMDNLKVYFRLLAPPDAGRLFAEIATLVDTCID